MTDMLFCGKGRKLKDFNTESFYASSKRQRLGWLWVIALAANVLLFLSISWVNRAPANLPRQERAYVELFQPPPAPSPIPRQTYSAPVIIQAEISPIPQPVRLGGMQNAFSAGPRLTERLPEATVSLPGVAVNVSQGQADTSALPASAGISEVLSAGQVDKPPVKISGALPRYPAWARAKKSEGSVTLRFLVTVDGAVGDIEIYSVTGDSRFAAAAREEIRKWRFSPAINRSAAVAVWCVQTIYFKLED